MQPSAGAPKQATALCMRDGGQGADKDSADDVGRIPDAEIGRKRSIAGAPRQGGRTERGESAGNKRAEGGNATCSKVWLMDVGDAAAYHASDHQGFRYIEAGKCD